MSLLLLTVFPGRATILTFEDFAANNANVSTAGNPFGAGQYGSRAGSAINTGFQQGDGWTTNVVLTWGNGWQTYTAWPFGNNAQSGAGDVAQADFDASGGSAIALTFTPDATAGVWLKSFAFTVWNGSPVVPVQIRWTVYGGSVALANVLATGQSSAIGASGGAETINTGLTSPYLGGSPVILYWELLSGDGTYVAINNVHFTQSAALQQSVVTWTQPDAIVVGTGLSGTQLNAMANVPGTFVYTPESGTVLPAGTHTLRVDFTPTDTNTYTTASNSVQLLVKSNNIPVVFVRAPQQIGTNDPLTAAMFRTNSDVRGTFSFSPLFGTRLPLGNNSIMITFTPDSGAFVTVNTNVSILALPSVVEGTVWTFNDPADRFRQLSGDDELSFHDPSATGWPATKIAFGLASSFGLPLPSGGDSDVMRFENRLATEGLKVTFNDPANGGFRDNGWLANYTLVFDLLYPTNGATRPLYNAGLNNTTGPEAFINNALTAAVQILTLSWGEIRSNTWHRVTLVVRSASAEGQVHVYIDGTFIGAIGSNDTFISAPYALQRIVYLLTSATGNGSIGYLGGVRFVGRNLDYAEVNALGGVHADGPQQAGPPAPRPPFQPLRDVVNIGHRGNGGFAPEDTLPAFMTAFDGGADVVEVDVRRTSDSRVVVMHDPTVDRTTDGSGSVSAMTLAQIQTFDAGSWFGPAFVGTPPPALRDVMVAVLESPHQSAILYLDLKVNGMASLVKTDADTVGFPYDQLWFWVYDQIGEAGSYRATFPNAKIIWGEGNWHNGASINTWPSLTPAQKQAVVDGMKTRGVYGFDFGDNEANSLNPTTLQELRAAGFFVSCYSALHPRSMTSAINYLGVDGMETDFPPVLRALMPTYAATTTASPISDTAATIRWTPLPTNPPATEIRLRGKQKAQPTWTNFATGLNSLTRVLDTTGLRTNTLYEFQPIGYDAGGNPVTFGNVGEGTPLAVGNNFTNAYAAWQAGHPGVGAPSANPDGDGYVNLLEFFLDLDPQDPVVPDEAHPDVSIQSGQLRLQYTRRTGTFVRANYDGSTDLQNWTRLLELTDYTVTVQPGSPGTEAVTVTASIPSGAPNWFVRTAAHAIP